MANIDIQSLTVKDIANVYNGKVGCMCGCKGKYAYTKHGMAAMAVDDYRKDRRDINEVECLRVLRKVQLAAMEDEKNVDVDDNGEWISYDTAKGRRYCVYLAS